MSVAHFSWSSERPKTRTARPGETRSASIVMRPATSSSVPAAFAQLNLNVTALRGSPSAFVRSSPGQANSLVSPSSQSLTGPHWATAKTAMMIRYGA